MKMVSLKRPCNQIQEISCVPNPPNTMANCIICGTELTSTNTFGSDHRYCAKCGKDHAEFISYRKETLRSLQNMNLDCKIIQTNAAILIHYFIQLLKNKFFHFNLFFEVLIIKKNKV